MNTDGYRVLCYAAHVLDNAKVRLHTADAIPMRGGGWRYSYPNNRFIAASPVREEIFAALADAGPNHTAFCISLKHAIVLYPATITLIDLNGMDSGRDGAGKVIFRLSALLPFNEGPQRVDIVINTDQAEPLLVSD